MWWRLAMRSVVGGAIATAAVVAPASPTIPVAADFNPVTPAHLDALIAASTVQVVAFGCDLGRRDGTGVALRGAGLVTNRHVAGGSRMVDVAADTLPTTSVTGVAAAAAPDLDLARVEDPGLELPGLTLAPADPRPGTAVRVGGFPGAAPGQRPPGLVTDAVNVVDTVTVPGAGRVLRLSAPVRQGMSGGPVLDPAGNLAGILFGNEEPSGDALAIPASRVRVALSRPGSFQASSC